jgi:hypothetical protein
LAFCTEGRTNQGTAFNPLESDAQTKILKLVKLLGEIVSLNREVGLGGL